MHETDYIHATFSMESRFDIVTHKPRQDNIQWLGQSLYISITNCRLHLAPRAILVVTHPPRTAPALALYTGTLSSLCSFRVRA